MSRFYIIKHNPNVPSDAITALQQGANALEPDLTWDSNDFYVYDSDKARPTNPLTLKQYCTELATQLLANPYLNLALIAWDMKNCGNSHFDFWKIRDIIVENFIDILNDADYGEIPMLFTNIARYIKRFLSFFILFLCSTFAHSQNITDTTNSNVRGIIKVNPLQILFGELRVEYEKPLKHNVSLEFGAGFIYFYNYIQIKGDIDGFIHDGSLQPDWLYGTEIRSGIKIYFEKGKDHEGYYIYPLGFYKSASNTENYQNYLYTQNISTLGFQCLFGYNSPLNKRFFIDWYGGFGGRFVHYIHNNTDPNNNFYKSDEKFQFYTPQLGFIVGYKLYRK